MFDPTATDADGDAAPVLPTPTDLAKDPKTGLLNIPTRSSDTKAQAAFNQNNYHFDFTTPTLVKGKGHVINHGIQENSIVVEFETDGKKPLFLQICLKNR